MSNGFNVGQFSDDNGIFSRFSVEELDILSHGTLDKSHFESPNVTDKIGCELIRKSHLDVISEIESNMQSDHKFSRDNSISRCADQALRKSRPDRIKESFALSYKCNERSKSECEDSIRKYLH